ncbi:MAG: glycosyltransferase [Hydrogenophaga sp.]|nr:glycosyltransferase [Hydrogenophaga sp.]
MQSLKLGVVAIGRNEGERLRRCLASVLPRATETVYVDSGSSDGSPQMAADMGADVVHLDMSKPFTAARARNEGFLHLMRLHPDIQLIQFVDGDCEVFPNWLQTAADFLQGRSEFAVVCGRRRERYPEKSLYNQMCDEEWDTPIGDSLTCGGDAMMRVDALQAVGGYRDTMIAGEEPELCFRLRERGWRIHRLDVDMTMHDANMSRFQQWWMRTVRSGHAFAEGAWLHGDSPERFWVRESRRAWLWGLVIPVLSGLAILLVGPPGAAVLVAYPLQWVRLLIKSGSPTSSTFLVLGKFAETYGALKFHFSRLLGRRYFIIEYK